jgi:hypothetical protein
MNSLHFKPLCETLSNTLIAVIKDLIGSREIEINEHEKKLQLIDRMSILDKKQINVQHLCYDYITLSDTTRLKWEEGQNFENLLKCLEYLEYLEEKHADDHFSIKWGLIDFENRAVEIESDLADKSFHFNRSKFPFALKVLEERHDCNYGTTWQDVDEVLYEFCK